MRIESEHKITFVYDGNIEIPDIENPLYTYKIGDTIRYYDMWAEEIDGDKKPPVTELVVTDIKHDLLQHAIPDQVMVVYVDKVQ